MGSPEGGAGRAQGSQHHSELHPSPQALALQAPLPSQVLPGPHPWHSKGPRLTFTPERLHRLPYIS